MGDIVYTVFDW